MLEPEIIKKEFVKCMHCGKLHDISKETFFTFEGNVYIGLHGGIIGNNFDENGNIKRLYHVCATADCMNIFFKYIKSKYEENFYGNL